MRLPTLPIVISSLMVVASPSGSPREWTDSTGKFTVEATLVEVRQDSVILKKADGGAIMVPIGRLSKADQRYLEGLRKPGMTRAAGGSGAEEAAPVEPESIRMAPTLLEPPANHGGFFGFAFSPDGELVAGGTGVVGFSSGGRTDSRGGDVLEWNASSGKLIRTLGTHQATVSWVQYGDEGRKLASISMDNGLLNLWDTQDGRVARTLTLAERVYDTANVRPMLSPDARTLAVVDAMIEETVQGKSQRKTRVIKPRELTVWDLHTGKVRWSASAKTARGSAFSPVASVSQEPGVGESG